MNDCWNIIGVRGDRSCPELRVHLHCRNCPVYSAGALGLLDTDAPAGYLAEQTDHFAKPKSATGLVLQAVVIFRLGAEWLALPASCVKEVAERLPIHSLPHRQSGAILGVTSVRGELLACMSLSRILGLDESSGETQSALNVHRRLLVLRHEQVRAVCPVDEVHSFHKFHPQDLDDVPATVSRAAATYTKKLLAWNGHSVGVLDTELVFHTLKRSAA
jgi:chemotaxis-related protein WspD